MDTVNIQNGLPLLAGVGYNIIYVSYDGQGTINPPATIISDGKITQLFTFNPITGYKVGVIIINDVNLLDEVFTTAVVSGYQFIQARGFHTVYATFIFEATITINSIFDQTVETGMIAFIKVIATDEDSNESIWAYPLESGSNYIITIKRISTVYITFSSPINHATTTDNVGILLINQSDINTIINMTVAKNKDGYIYNTYYIS